MLALRPLSPPLYDDGATAGSSKRLRMLFVAEAVSLAHVGRPVLLARWAQAAGYEVLFACGPAHADAVRREGFEPLPLPTIAPDTFYDRLARGQFFYTADELAAYVRAEVELLAATAPDLVVGDFRLSLGVSTAVTAAPLVSLCNAYWSPAAACRFAPPRVGLFRLLPSGLRRALFAGLRPLAFRWFGRPLNEVRQRFGLAAAPDFRAHYTAGQWCAYTDLPGWVSMNSLPLGHFFLGPLAWQPRDLPILPLDSLGQGRPLAYVSMGSTGATRVLPNVLRSLLDLNCDIALSGVNEEQAADLGRRLPQFQEQGRLAPLFDPSQVLRRAVVTVCHGGSGTIYQSLAAGVPVLSLPDNADQGLAAAAAVGQGVGVLVESERATLPRLTSALSAVLKDAQYTARAAQVAGALRRHDTRQCWLDFLVSVLPGAARRLPLAQEAVRDWESGRGNVLSRI